MAKKNIQVVPDKKGWALKRGGSSRASATYTTKKEATTAARRIAGEQQLDVIIYERGRTFTEIRTSDPKLAHDPGKSISGKKSSNSAKSAEQTNGTAREKKSQLWRKWAAGHAKNRPALSDEAISRESIYGERG